MKRTLVILSGGLDSTVLAYHLKKDFVTELVGAVSVNYGQAHLRELECASRTCAALGIPHYLIDIESFGAMLKTNALTGGSELPHGHYEAASMKATVVPNRNMILIALAIGVAIEVEADSVAYGAHAGDHAVYPDCREEFAVAMNAVAQLCDYKPIELLRPFISLTKQDIVTQGETLGVDFLSTHSCYQGGKVACGRCGTCVERLEAFAAAGSVDPLDYADRAYWKTAPKH